MRPTIDQLIIVIDNVIKMQGEDTTIKLTTLKNILEGNTK